MPSATVRLLDLSRADIHELLASSIDVVIQVCVDAGKRVIREIPLAGAGIHPTASTAPSPPAPVLPA